jgi:hypothetical protein
MENTDNEEASSIKMQYLDVSGAGEEKEGIFQ